MNEHDDSRELYIVTYTGPFGFVKPWTAVRDILTFSQPFLTPSIVEGMRQKLGVEAIHRHRLAHGGITVQQERTQTAGWIRERNRMRRDLSIVNRGVMVQPCLTLAFGTRGEADRAAAQHVCLCRNEDVLLPVAQKEVTVDEFEDLPGAELVFGEGPDAFLVGYNRFDGAAPMYGRLVVVGGVIAQEPGLW